MKHLILFALFYLLCPLLASGDPQLWMKKENPNELVINTQADEDCPLDAGALKDIAEAVLTKSKIKPVDSYESPMSETSSNVYLQVSLTYMPEQAPAWVQEMAGSEEPLTLTPSGEEFVVLAVDFVGLTYYSRSEMTWVRFGSVPASGFIGKGSGDTLDLLVKSRIEEAVADYHKANFGPENAEQ